FRVPDHEIGVAAFRNAALAMLQAGKLGRGLAHPAHKLPEAVPTPLRFSPDHGQAELQRADAAPGAHEVSMGRELHFRRTGRMVAGHKVKSAIAESRP